MKSAILTKPLSILLLLCLCFSGCSKSPDVTTVASSGEENSTEESTTKENSVTEGSLEETESSAPEDTSLYPDAVYQDDTLIVLDLDLDIRTNEYSILPYGDNLLVASSLALEWGDASIDTEDRTVHLFLYDPQTGKRLHETDITGMGINAYQVSVTADGRIAVADSRSQYIQFLDETLTVQSSLTVPAFTVQEVSSEYISLYTDPAFTYGYFTLHDNRNIYKVDMNTGEVSTLYSAKEDANGVYILSILFDGGVLIVSEYTDTASYQRFISAEDGSELSNTTAYLNLSTYGNSYYGILFDSNEEGRLVYGSADSKRFYHTMQLDDPYNWTGFTVDEEQGTFIHYLPHVSEASTLYCYDLKEGVLRSKNDLSSWLTTEEGSYDLYCFDKGVMENHLYYALLLDWEQNFARLILWNPYKEPAAEESYSRIPVLGGTAEPDIQEPDIELDAAYTEVRAFANGMEDVYGVKIRIANECATLNPPDYAVQLLSDVDTIQNCLYVLTEGLAAFPPGFFNQMKSDFYPEGLVIYLCSTLTGTTSTTLGTAGGITYTDRGQHVMALDCSNGFSMTDFYHETMHVIDNHISSQYYDSTQPGAFTEEKWAALNPEGFSYTFDYSTHSTLDTSDTSFDILLADSLEQIYFIDTYSKVKPMEDRARIFENAMFYRGPFLGSDCPHIQQKLKYICDYIRFHFDSEGWTSGMPWEEALK